MKPKFEVGKLPMLGNTEAISASASPNQRASVAAYWSTDVVGIQASARIRSAIGVVHPAQLQMRVRRTVCRGIHSVEISAQNRTAEDDHVIAPCMIGTDAGA